MASAWVLDWMIFALVFENTAELAFAFAVVGPASASVVQVAY